MTTEEFVTRWNDEHPNGPLVEKTSWGFRTVPYCKKFDTYTVHIHAEGETCQLDKDLEIR